MKYFVERIIVIPVKDGEILEKQHYAAKFLSNNQYELTEYIQRVLFQLFDNHFARLWKLFDAS